MSALKVWSQIRASQSYGGLDSQTKPLEEEDLKSIRLKDEVRSSFLEKMRERDDVSNSYQTNAIPLRDTKRHSFF